MKSQDLKQQILEEFLEQGYQSSENEIVFGIGELKEQLTAALTTLEQGVLGEAISELREHRERFPDADYNDIVGYLAGMMHRPNPTPKEIKDCDYCEGMGLRTVSVETDDGRGEIQKEECSKCNGKGKVQMKTNYT